MSDSSEDWFVVQLYISSPNEMNEVLEVLDERGKKLMAEGFLADFYYNMYDRRVKFGFYKASEQTQGSINKTIDALRQAGKVQKAELTDPDLNDLDGLPMDIIKCTSRRVSQLIKKDFKRVPTFRQAVYLVHFAMNQFCFSYDEESKIYQELLLMAKRQLRKIAFGDEADKRYERLITLANEYSKEFNSSYAQEGVSNALERLSSKLAIEIDKVFQRFDPGTGQLQTRPLENLMWAVDLIVAAWEGWLHQAKAVEHYGRPVPDEMALLEFCIAPSKLQAIDLGKHRAVREKAVAG